MANKGWQIYLDKAKKSKIEAKRFLDEAELALKEKMRDARHNKEQKE